MEINNSMKMVLGILEDHFKIKLNVLESSERCDSEVINSVQIMKYVIKRYGIMKNEILMDSKNAEVYAKYAYTKISTHLNDYPDTVLKQDIIKQVEDTYSIIKRLL